MNNVKNHKPVIETIINTTALALTSFGVLVITQGGEDWNCILRGSYLILLGAGLEWFKYVGRAKELW